MRLAKREPSGREKDQAAIEQLEHLREKVYCENSSMARHAAFNLSWMQEDGLDILKEALYGNGTRTSKSAAAYGLRKMRGRMKKQAMKLLEEGQKHGNEDTRQVSSKALRLVRESKEAAKQGAPQQQPGQQQKRRFKPKFRISEIPPKKSQGYTPRYGRRNPPQSPGFNR